MKQFLALTLVSVLSSASMAADLLNDHSYEKEGVSCYTLVLQLAAKTLPHALTADSVVPLSHVSVTPGTYNQTFVSVVAVDENIYSIVSNGSYSCDSMTAVNFQKIVTE